MFRVQGLGGGRSFGTFIGFHFLEAPGDSRGVYTRLFV